MPQPLPLAIQASARARSLPAYTTPPAPAALRLRTQPRLLSWHWAQPRAERAPITPRAVLPRWQGQGAPARPWPHGVRRSRGPDGRPAWAGPRAGVGTFGATACT